MPYVSRVERGVLEEVTPVGSIGTVPSDRTIQEKDFGRIQIDRIAEKWAENIKNVQEHMNLAVKVI